MYPLEVKGEKADHEGAELDDFVEKQEPQGRTPRLFLAVRLLLVLAAVLVAFDYLSSFPPGRTRSIKLCTKGKNSHDKVDFNTVDFWNTVPVSWYQHKDILWKDCYGEKQCARFAVPLDYLDESQDGPWATIALVRVPAKVSPESPAYKGPILFNPGGPGGSGVALIVQLGNTFQQVLGPEFDIVGFDPRGVGFTTPSLSVFDDQAEEVAWVLRETTAPLWNSSSDAVAKIHARATVINKLASDRAGHTAAYASTASVSRDMLEITRAHGRDKLQYWGFSYGSILGATYAAMFPNNVGRLIIDGVMDTKNYYDTLWSKNLVDTEAGLKLFFEGCVEAGPELCGLYESTAEKVQARYENILNNLKRRPLAVPTIGQDSTAIDYGIIDYTLVKSLVFLFLYSPYARTPDAGSAASHLSFRLNEVEKGEGLPLWNALKYGLPRFECTRGPHATLAPVATYVIACGDGKAVNDSVDELEEFFYELNSTFADVWPIRARCSNWKVKPKYRFTGPFGGNTSYPLLIVGNTADPVTPLSSAHSVSRDFKNSSVVLTQNSAGHCSIAALSICSAKAIRSYLRDGVLPKQGTVCETEATIFGGKDSSLLDSLSAEEQGLVEGWSELQEAFSMPGFGLVQSQLRGL